MQNDKRKFRIKYLFLGAFLITLLVAGLQVYFLIQQFDKTNKLVHSILDESLYLSINKYQMNELSEGSDISENFKFSFTFGKTGSTQTVLKDTLEQKSKKQFDFTWSANQHNNVTALLQSFMLLVTRNNRLSTVDLIKLDSIYKHSLYEKGLTINHTMQLTDVETKQVITQTDSSLVRNHKSLEVSSSYPLTVNENIRILFLNTDSLVLKQMAGTILITALMLILTVCCLLYYLRIISKQKRIESVREDFVHSMTHELRNPLQGAMSLFEMLNDKSVQSNETMYNNISGRIRKNLIDLNTQIDTLLILSLSEKKQEKMNLQEGNLTEMLQDIASTYTIAANKPVHFSLITEPDPCIFDYDTIHFSNAIKNLIDNALKYSGSEVNINITVLKTKDQLRISIKDNGIGILEEYLPYIFDQYYRVSPLKQTNGFGLGLSYVKWVIEAHGGSIRVESKEGIGSDFIIVITLK